MSHELRTPLTVVIGMISLLLNTKLKEDQQGILNIIKLSADTLLHIINDLLDFSTLESGQLKLKEIPFDVCTAVEDMALTSVGMARIAAFAPPTVRIVTVCDTLGADDDFLFALARIETLSKVTLRACPTFSEAGIAAVMALPNLHYLDVRGCPQINDSWVPLLSERWEMTYLGLAGTGVTPAGIAQLRHALPTTRIDVDQAVWDYMDDIYRASPRTE
jgi:hypothetical protein